MFGRVCFRTQCRLWSCCANDITRCLAVDPPPRAVPVQPFQRGLQWSVRAWGDWPEQLQHSKARAIRNKKRVSSSWMGGYTSLARDSSDRVSYHSNTVLLGIPNRLSHTRRSCPVSPIIQFTCRRVQQVLHPVLSLALFDFHLLTTSSIFPVFALNYY